MKEVTQQDVIDYIEEGYDSTHYKVQGNKLMITQWVAFDDFEFSTLPSGMIFNSVGDLRNSNIEYLPDDIVFHNSLYLSHSKVRSLPILGVARYLVITGIEAVLQDGTYIESKLWSKDTSYQYIDGVVIDGYVFSTGVLS